MMAPRLTLARNLLCDDGVIFLSIDDNEVANLRMLCDEVFGSENFVECYIWNSTFRPDNSSQIYRKNAEFVICCAKKKSAIDRFVGETADRTGLPSLTKTSMESSVLTFASQTVSFDLEDGRYEAGPRGTYELLDDVQVTDGKNVDSFRLKGPMIWGQSYLESEQERGTEIIIKKDTFTPYSKKAGDAEMRPSKLIPKNTVGDVLAANAETRALLQQDVFDYPKPTTLLRHLIRMRPKSDIILDFFAGSGTTGHAVMAQNAEDGGNRRYICVQLPEPLHEPVTLDDGVVCETIFDLTRERLKRAGKKIKSEAGLNADKLDTGLRVFKLDGSNFTAWNSDPTTSEADLLDRLEQLADHTVPGRSETDILWEILLKMGLPLDLKLERFEVEGAPGIEFIGVADRTKVISTETAIPTAALEALLDQDIPPSELVVLDSAFENDTARANIATLYKQRKDDDGKPVCNLRVV